MTATATTERQKAALHPIYALIRLAPEFETQPILERDFEKTRASLEPLIEDGMDALHALAIKGMRCSVVEHDAFQAYDHSRQECQRLAQKFSSSPAEIRRYAENGHPFALRWQEMHKACESYRKAIGTTVLAIAFGEDARIAENLLGPVGSAEFKRDRKEISLGTFLVEPTVQKTGDAQKAAAYLHQHGIGSKAVTIVRCSSNGYTPEQFRAKYSGIKLCLAARKAYDAMMKAH